MDLNGQPLRVVYTNELKVCEHNDIIHHVEYDFYSQRLALVSSDKIVSVYTKMSENKGWAKTGMFKVNGGATWRIRWAHPSYGQVLATASFDGNVFIFQETAKINSCLDSQKEQLIQCEWKQRAHIPSFPPASVTDIRFVPHFFGLLLGACDSRGFVTVYECQNVLNLDIWSPIMNLSAFEYGCRALAFSTDRFNTLLIATCTDDDRARADRQVAIFPFVRNCDADVPPPDITYLYPTAELSVHLPPTDLEFSPTGAYAFQRLAIAVGPCIVLFHVNTVPLEKSAHCSDSPLSTISESSVNTVVMAPKISITNAKSDGEDQNEDSTLSSLKIESSTSNDFFAVDSKGNHSAKGQYQLSDKGPRKSVQFKMDSNSTQNVPKSPKDDADPELVKIKPSLKKSKPGKSEDGQFKHEEIAQMKGLHRKSRGSESMEVEASASDEITSPSPIQDESSTPTSRPIDIVQRQSSPAAKGEDEEKADEADSETSDAPTGQKTTSDHRTKESQQGEYVFDSQGIYTTFQPIGPEMVFEQQQSASSPQRKPKTRTIFGDDDFDSPFVMPRITSKKQESRSSSALNKTPETLGSPQITSKDRHRHMKMKKKRHQVDNDDKDLGNLSSSSSDSNSKIGRNLKKHNFEKIPSQHTTTEFRLVDGKYESAVIKVNSAEGPRRSSFGNENEDDLDQVKIITLRQAILRAGKSQTKRISFNHTGSLITAVYADGRVRIWKRITPVMWRVESIINPPLVKGREELSVSSEGAYY